MEAIISHITNNIAIYILLLGFIILVILLFLLRPKKVKPIDLEKVEEVKQAPNEIERVLEVLQANKDSRPMTTFEEEQEANAIISYQELVEAVKQKKEMMGETKEEVTNENIVEPKLEVPEVKVEVDEIINSSKENRKFKSSEFISPIFGKDGNKTNDDFLKELKDFRNSL